MILVVLLSAGLAGGIPSGCAGAPGPASVEETQRTPARHEFARLLMGARCRIVVEGGTEEEAAAACAAAFDRIAALDAALSDYRADSESSRLTRAPAGVWRPVSADLTAVLAQSRRVYEATGGAFDPSVGPLTRLWRQSRASGRMPGAAELADALDRTGLEQVELDAGLVRLRKPGMLLDFGGIGKGYAADEALRVLAAEGFPAALIDFSGDLVAGDPPTREPLGWSVRVRAADGTTGRRRLKHGAIAASGDLEQFVEIDGVRYAHIVDPRTGLGVRGPVAATVGAPSGALADALASAACVMGPERAERLEDAFESVWVECVAGE